jgi:hypothetical protein
MAWTTGECCVACPERLTTRVGRSVRPRLEPLNLAWQRGIRKQRRLTSQKSYQK